MIDSHAGTNQAGWVCSPRQHRRHNYRHIQALEGPRPHHSATPEAEHSRRSVHTPHATCKTTTALRTGIADRGTPQGEGPRGKAHGAASQPRTQRNTLSSRQTCPMVHGEVPSSLRYRHDLLPTFVYKQAVRSSDLGHQRWSVNLLQIASRSRHRLLRLCSLQQRLLCVCVTACSV